MKKTIKKAGFGILVGTAMALTALPAAARGPVGGGQGPAGGLGLGAPGGIFASEFAKLDADGNGLITEEDLLAQAQARLAEADADGNGTLSLEELTAQTTARIEERLQTRTSDQRMGDPANMAQKMAQRMLGARDADKDGVLSLTELSPDKGFGRVIDRFDTDDDNAISQTEYDEAKAEMQDRMARNEGNHGGRRGPDGQGFGGKRR